MPRFNASQLQSWTHGCWVDNRALAEPITGFSQDTRQLKPGMAFVALKTSKRDGHTFLSEAATKGASAAIVQSVDNQSEIPQLLVGDTLKAFQSIAEEYRKTLPGKVIGVTGSCGKTSTKDLLALLLGPGTHKTEANLNNIIGVPLTLTRIGEDHAFAVVEAGINEPGEMDILGRMIAGDATVITLVAPAHLEKLGTVANVAVEKARLACLAKPGGPVFFPASCLAFEPFQHWGQGARIALPEGCQAAIPEGAVTFHYKTEIHSKRGTCRLTIETAGSPGSTFDLPMVTEGMAGNVVLAIAAAREFGVSDTSIRERLKDWKPAHQRGEIRIIGNQHFYIDCYNANPASMKDTLSMFERCMPEAQPRLYVLGCMLELGDQSEALHRDTGACLSLRPNDRAVVIGPQANAFRSGCAEAERVRICSSVEEARPEVECFSGAILLKGSRHFALEQLLPSMVEERMSC